MKTAIWCIVFLSLSLLAYSSAVDKNTVLLLNFDKDSVMFKSGEIVGIRDQSGNDNDATVNTQSGEPAVNLNVKPSGPPELVDGRFGKGLHFDGTNSLEVLTSESLEVSDGITLEAWVNPEVLTIGADSMTVVTKDTSYYMVLRDNGLLSCYFYGTDPPGYHQASVVLPAT